METKYTLTELLNLFCADNGKRIKEGEVVRLYDWGVNRTVLGYGAYVWDKHERAFNLEMHKRLNDYFDYDNSGIEDRYDLFRTSPEKLNKEELEILNQ